MQETRQKQAPPVAVRPPTIKTRVIVAICSFSMNKTPPPDQQIAAYVNLVAILIGPD